MDEDPRFPAYILTEEKDGIIYAKPIYFDNKTDAMFVGDSLAKINDLLFLTGYQVIVVPQSEVS